MGLSSNLSALSNPHFSPKFPMINVATLSLLFFCIYFVQNRDILILYVPQFSVFHHITRLFGILSHQILYFTYYWYLKLGLGLQSPFFLSLFFKYSLFNHSYVASSNFIPLFCFHNYFYHSDEHFLFLELFFFIFVLHIFFAKVFLLLILNNCSNCSSPIPHILPH